MSSRFDIDVNDFDDVVIITEYRGDRSIGLYECMTKERAKYLMWALIEALDGRN